jgi:hypothetical protein
LFGEFLVWIWARMGMVLGSVSFLVCCYEIRSGESRIAGYFRPERNFVEVKEC